MKARAIGKLFVVLTLAGAALTAAPAQAAPPSVAGTSFSQTTTTSTLLGGEVDPGGKATTYHFEYGLGDCASGPCTTVPVPDAEVAGLVKGKGDVEQGSFDVTNLSTTTGNFGPGQTITGPGIPAGTKIGSVRAPI